jgi:hypothetical protein
MAKFSLVGRSVFIRTVTHNHVGTIVRVTKSLIVLKDASWVADSGRLSVALNTGALVEVEEMPGEVCVSRGALIDISEWKHALPVRTQGSR